MFDYSEIITTGSDLVGWRQPAQGETISSGLLSSSSGLYVNDLSGVDYEVMRNAYGRDFKTINDYLYHVHSSELNSLVRQFYSRAQERLGARVLLNNFDVTNGVADYSDLATKNARFVGWLISPNESNSVKIAITKLGLQLSESESVKVFLYETSQQQPIATTTISYNSPLSLTWTAVNDFIVKYRGQYGTRQQYLLGYYENDPSNSQDFQLSGQAVRYQFDCGCSNSPRRHFGRYVDIQPIVIENSDLNFSGSDYLLPNTSDLTRYYSEYSHGLFAKINVTCDVTDILVDNIDNFAGAFQYKVAVRVLNDFLNNKEFNSVNDARQNRNNVEKARNIYENWLNGWTDNAGHKHRGLIDNLTVDFSRMDRVCLPCVDDEIRTGFIRSRRSS